MLRKNKIQPSKFKALTGFVQLFVNWAAFHLTTRRALRGTVQMEGFFRWEGGAGKSLAKGGKKGLFWARTSSFWRKGTAGVFTMQIASSLRGWVYIERTHMTDHLISADQKIPSWLIKITFLKKVETATEAGSKSRFGIVGFM